ncbi:tRNA-2-methylthio-N6-dimethylallyladenosine synthase [Chitinophaga costaii]|uniref:tRNA-2-methylthio-N(6)-dimethylallyladenosine synthase n=1 Tax=Chitinophaga costaii TaxID=1335309 RepID=A0A1C4EQP0_9BACT|nr:tRNA (N6-isopentenyl adenosine(37)-C2)-methylthiotransferase MiaB [Chitinophaga costaii]PUZ22526.1 tRNA (N6-isopentenyl adenosine(37)-C2)-methylthiotransferase MiaB [Chitinophaga costaii]SCC45938.1 tRNA-2-methylthio-N6-dimethylallyladenosine synthase [Chitinophaga costaii]
MLETVVKAHDETRQGEAYAPHEESTSPFQKNFYIESYGCAMNFNDSEIVASILQGEGFGATRNVEEADLILLNTCSIREKAEQTVRKRLTEFRKLKKAKPGMLVGVLGCMAERLKDKLLVEEKLVDMVVGPDAYRTLPGLIEEANTGQKAVNVLLSREETYGDISPIRLDSNGVSGYVSIMRGCNNMCTFCVVPFTRGRERSRDAASIVAEARDLFERGFREVTLLGQNVDSYHWMPSDSVPGITEPVTFAQLLASVAEIDPLLRVRFSTSHPKDITDEVLFTMAKYENICNYIHLPLQSGSSRILQLMNRTYTREWYIKKVDRIREILPDCGLSTDIITGFCTETDADHADTLSLMQYAKYDLAYMYFYSERPGTLAARRYQDDIPETLKKQRLAEVVALHRQHTLDSMRKDVGKSFKVLIEGTSKRSSEHLYGRNDQNKVVIFPKGNLQKGQYVHVTVTDCTAGTLIAESATAL